MSGRKPISIPYVFENVKYLNILFLIFIYRNCDKQLKKKILKKKLIKNGKIDFKKDTVIKNIAETGNSVIFVQKYIQYQRGFLPKYELEQFSKIKPEQFFYDNLFDNEKQLTKYLGYLKKPLDLITNRHDKRGTYWDFTDNGLKEFYKFYYNFMLDFCIETNPKHFEKNMKELDKLLMPKFPFIF